jgi:hypothetical protein
MERSIDVDPIVARDLLDEVATPDQSGRPNLHTHRTMPIARTRHDTV